MELLQGFKKIRAFIFDMDGVITDGMLLIMANGLQARRMNIKDGFALQLAVNKGYGVVVVSGAYSAEMEQRFASLGITEVYMSVEDKKEFITKLMRANDWEKEHVLYMADDLPDAEVMHIVGMPCCPADAIPEIKEIVTYIATQPGGNGCVREVIEKTMRLNGDWVYEAGVSSK